MGIFASDPSPWVEVVKIAVTGIAGLAGGNLGGRSAGKSVLEGDLIRREDHEKALKANADTYELRLQVAAARLEETQRDRDRGWQEAEKWQTFSHEQAEALADLRRIADKGVDNAQNFGVLLAALENALRSGKRADDGA